MPVNASVGIRISMLRTLLIMFVVFLHLGGPPMAELDYTDSVALIRFFFQDVLGRLAVPTLSVVAGYLLFAASADRTPAKLYKNKLRTLFVPFLFFNVLYFGIQYGIEYATGWAPLFELVNRPVDQLIDAATSYKTTPLNVALHFLRDLMVLVVLAPLFGYFLRHRPVLGFVLVFGIFMNDFDRRLINRDSMAVLFYLGGLAATSRCNLTRYDHLGKYALAVLLLVCLATMYLRIDDYVYVYLTAPFAVWPASSLLLGTRVGEWLVDKSKYSFFLFLSHSPLIRIAELFYAKFVPGMSSNLYIVIAFVVIVTVTMLIYDVLARLIPTTFAFLTGGRSQHSIDKRHAFAKHDPDAVVVAR